MQRSKPACSPARLALDDTAIEVVRVLQNMGLIVRRVEDTPTATVIEIAIPKLH